MSLAQIARRYARALLEVARESGQLAAAVSDMTAIAKLFDAAPEIRAWCREDLSHVESAVEFVRTAFLPLVGRQTAAMLFIAAAHGRLAALPLLPPAFEAELAGSNTVRVTLETAKPADDELVALVKARVAERTGRAVEIRVSTVPSLVAGFRAFWDNWLWDGSARGRLAALGRRLTSGGGSS